MAAWLLKADILFLWLYKSLSRFFFTSAFFSNILFRCFEIAASSHSASPNLVYNLGISLPSLVSILLLTCLSSVSRDSISFIIRCILAFISSSLQFSSFKVSFASSNWVSSCWFSYSFYFFCLSFLPWVWASGATSNSRLSISFCSYSISALTSAICYR